MTTTIFKIKNTTALFFAGLILLSGCGTPSPKTTATEKNITALTTFLSKAKTNYGDEFAFQFNVVPDTLPFTLPALQACATATYNGLWIFIGGRKAGMHGMVNDPPPFRTVVANDSIWVVDMQNGIVTGVGVPQIYAPFLSATNQPNYQAGNTLYLCGGFTAQDTSSTQFNWTSDRFFEIDLPSLVQYVQSGGSNPALNQVFTKVIQSPYVQVTGGQMMVVNNNFYLVGGQNYVGPYLPGATGIYTNAIRKFNLANGGSGWSIADTASLIDAVNLHRRDFNLVPAIAQDDDSTRAIIYGGVFTPAGLGYRNPVYISGLTSGSPSITVDTMHQDANQYSCATIATAFKYVYYFNVDGIIGGISYMMYDSATQQMAIPPLGMDMPFSNVISTMLNDGQSFSLEGVQLPPNTLLPSYIGANAAFFPNTDYLLDGYGDILDMAKIFNNYAGTPVLIGYMYGGIQSLVPTLITPFGNYSTWASNNVYKVYMYIPAQVQ